MTAPLYLASASARRQRLLTEWGFDFTVVIPDVEEVHYMDDLHRSVHDNAIMKCQWARARYPEARILAADTGITFQGQTIMKPRSRAQAVQFLQQFSGQTHSVMTGVALARPTDEITVHVVESRVTFRALSEETIHTYIDRVNPLDRAGAYDIAEHGDMLIARYEGSYTNIVGLPRKPVIDWLMPGDRRRLP